MGIKISELTSGSSVNGDDQYPAVQGSSTKKFSPSQMASYVLNTFSSLSLGGVVRTVKVAIDSIATTVASHTTLLGDSTMGTTATTVTGAIAEHEGDITTLNSNLNYKSGDSFSARTWRAMGRVTNAGNAIYCWIDLGKPITASGFTVNIGSINTFGGISPTYSGTTSSHSISGNELIFALNLSNTVTVGTVVLLELNNTSITLT